MTTPDASGVAPARQSAPADGWKLVRRYWPPIAITATCAVALVHTAVTGRGSPVWIATGLAMFVALSRLERTRADVISVCAAPLAFVFANVILVDDPRLGEILDVVWLGVAAAAGEAMRNHRLYVREVEARARHAEETRELEAQRRVAEERLRIARDLHDAMAHQIAVISVQAGAAFHLLDARPEQAREALVHVRSAAGSVLDEMKTIVEMLRGAEGRELPLVPAPSITQLSSLVAPYERAGLRVQWRVEGEIGGLPAAVDAVACSTIQEALTNAYKHAPGATAVLLVEWTGASLRVQVENEVAADVEPAAGTGTGLAGLRERVASVGGSMQAGCVPGGEYRLVVTIPVQEQR
jgi:signal transduction histidine kinase